MRPFWTFRLRFLVAGAMALASGSCSRSGTARSSDGEATPDEPASTGGISGGSGGSGGSEDAAVTGFGDATIVGGGGSATDGSDDSGGAAGGTTSGDAAAGDSMQSGYIYISRDSGATWTQTGTQQNWSCVASSADGTKLFAAVYGGHIYTSL